MVEQHPEPVEVAPAEPAAEPAAAEPAAEPAATTQPEVFGARSNAQQKAAQQVSHVRVGAGQGSGVRVQQIERGVQRRHVGRTGDVQDSLQVPRAALEDLRAAVQDERKEDALKLLDGWIGAVEAAQSSPPPAAEEGAQTNEVNT